MAIYVNAGEKEVKRADFGSKLEQYKAMHESDGASRRSNVATSPRRDVPTSRRWVNHCKSQQAVTSRRLNVVTSERRDVAKSRRQREICPPSLKAPRVQNSREGGNVRPRAWKSRAAATLITKKSPRFVLFPIFGQ